MPKLPMCNPLKLCAVTLLFAAMTSHLGSAQETEWFREISAELGVDFQHADQRTGEKFYTETAASGGGFLDFDNDGDLDIYLVNGAPQPGSKSPPTTLTNRLYENRGGRFHDVTTITGTADKGYGMGMCVGDINSDGRLDFLVTNYGPDRLFVAQPNGTFSEQSHQAGLDDPRWGASCAFADLDGDGDHDLYVSHYVDFDYETNPFCGDRVRNLRAYCHPSAFGGVSDSLFINRGDGTFTEEGVLRGIVQGKEEKGFGVLITDLDNDHDLDILVANDGTQNRLYVNKGNGFFEEAGLLAGIALSRMGRAESGMGIAVGDIDGDGRPDLFVTNYSMETNTLYHNRSSDQQPFFFQDDSHRRGLADPSYPYVGWGTEMFDLDNDADLDLAVVNGHAVDNIEVFEAGLRYAQPNLLFLNNGAGRFTDESEKAGRAWTRAKVSRGLAVGDFNNDGKIDVLVTNNNGAPDLLLNQHKNSNHWITIELTEAPERPIPIGARVELYLQDQPQKEDRAHIAEVRSGGSFLSQSDLRLHFGLGAHQGMITARIRWADGATQVERTDRTGRIWKISRRKDHSLQ